MSDPGGGDDLTGPMPGWALQMELRLTSNILRIEASILSQMTVLQTNIHNGFTALRVDLMQRLDRLQTRADGMHDDITVNFARADRVGGNTQALATEVEAMERQIRRLRAEMDDLKRGEGTA